MGSFGHKQKFASDRLQEVQRCTLLTSLNVYDN